MQTAKCLLLSFGMMAIVKHCAAQNQFRHQFAAGFGYPYTALNSRIKNCPLIRVQFGRYIHRFSIDMFGAVGIFNAYKLEKYGSVKVPMETALQLAVVGLRGNFYILAQERFDIYAGISAAMSSAGAARDHYLESSPSNGYVPREPVSESVGFRMGFHAGGHFWFRERTGLFVEIGCNTGLFNAGIAIRR